MDGRRVLHWAWIILGICFVNLFVNYTVRLGYSVILPEMIRTIGFGRAGGGSIINSLLFTYVCIAPLTGYVTDRFGARPVITCCLVIFGCGVFFMGTVDALWTACLFFAIAGLGATADLEHMSHAAVTGQQEHHPSHDIGHKDAAGQRIGLDITDVLSPRW